MAPHVRRELVTFSLFVHAFRFEPKSPAGPFCLLTGGFPLVAFLQRPFPLKIIYAQIGGPFQLRLGPSRQVTP